MRTVAIVAVENCISSVVYGVQDIFGIANDFIKASNAYGDEHLFNPVIVGRTLDAVTSFTGAKVLPEQPIDEIGDAEFVIVAPIGRALGETVRASESLSAWLTAMAERGAKLCSTCTGAFLLAETGLLDGYQATTNPGRAAQFRKYYPNVDLRLERLITDSGQIICCGATYAFVDLVIYLIEKECGADIAIEVSRVLVTDKNRVDQRPYIPLQTKQFHHDQAVRTVQERIQKDYMKPLTLADLAEEACVSVRNLTRRFRIATDQTPNAYLQAVRIDKSRELLELTDQTVEDITLSIGYEDVRSFSRLFKKQTGLTPKTYRERFKARDLAGQTA